MASNTQCHAEHHLVLVLTIPVCHRKRKLPAEIKLAGASALLAAFLTHVIYGFFYFPRNGGPVNRILVAVSSRHNSVSFFGAVAFLPRLK